MKCPICGNETRMLILTSRGQRCVDCKTLSEAECYEKLVARIDETISGAKVLAAEAYRDGNMNAHWEMATVVRNLERQKESMRKPNTTKP